MGISPAGPRVDFLNGLTFFGDALAGLGGARNDLINIIFMNILKQSLASISSRVKSYLTGEGEADTDLPAGVCEGETPRNEDLIIKDHYCKIEQSK